MRELIAVDSYGYGDLFWYTYFYGAYFYGVTRYVLVGIQG